MGNWRVVASFVGSITVLLLLFVGIAAAIGGWQIGRQAGVLIILSIALLIGLLGLLAVAFSGLGLSDRTQALGLPEGSVRAVIALMLLVIFGSLTVFVYTNMAGKPDEATAEVKTDTTNTGSAKTDSAKTDSTKTDSTKTDSTKTDSTKTESTKTVSVNTDSTKSDSTKTDSTNSGTPKKTDTTSQPTTVRGTSNQQANDLARELLVMLGTLLTSVCSFYFGSRTAAPSGTTVPPPHVSGVNPNSYARANGTLHDFQISGTALQSVDRVKITQGGSTVTASNVVSNATLVKCDLPIVTTLNAGTWNVVVGTPDGATASLPDGLTLT